MQQNQITRRQAVKSGVAGALTWAATAAVPKARASGEVETPASSTLGIATLGFSDLTNAELAKELAGQGIEVVQLFLNQTDSRYWKYNGRSDVSALTTKRCAAIGEAYRAAGVSIHSLGVYTNLIHPDQAERDANLAYFEDMMRIARDMGVHTLITEAGHWHAETLPPPRVPHHLQEEVWGGMVTTAKDLARRAEKYDATVLFEPFFRGFLASAKRTRLFLEAVDSPRVRALLDPANLLEVNDLEEMFDQLAPWIDCLHAKDRKLHVDRGVAAGLGDLDYRKLVRLAAEHTPKAPLILEYVGADDYRQALGVVRGAMRPVKVSVE